MSRRLAPAGPTISLFPFLAVLLCTMGSLLVLLVLFSNSARQADTAAEAAAAREQVEEFELARDELAWRLDQLEGVRTRTAEELATARLQLAGIEDDARTLIDEFEQLQRTAAALEEPADDDDEAAETIRELEQRLAAARDALETAREGVAERPPAYAVVPFEGPGGTRRRPLYIECCIDGVFLQPEGIRLGPGDFEGPPGPGNPLASGLRAAREYLATRSGEPGDPGGQPYPLLIVRPSGVMAYYAAREALQSWGSDFGYQFIDEDWTLTFPPADPALAEVEARAVAEARRRLEWLSQVRPRQRSKPAVQYRASSTRGGVVATGGPSVLGDQSRWDWTEEQAAAGRGFRADGDGSGGGGDAVLGRDDGNADGGAADGRWASGPGGSGSAAAGGDGRYLGPSKFYGGSGSGVGGDGATGGPAATGFGDHEGGLAAAGLAGGDASSGPDSTGLESGEGPGGAGASAGTAGGSDAGGLAANAQTGASGGAEGSGESTGSGSTGGGSAGSAAAGAGGGGSFGPALPGMAGAQAQASAGASSGDCSSGDCSLAGRRGSNWASLASHDRPIPLTRPIRLECAADEFRILGGGGRVTARVPISGQTAAAIDPLVREVHRTVGEWGMAGDRMYWKPELVLSATPDGADRRKDLEQLLADSGLDTRRAGDADSVRSLPPVRRARGVSFPR